MRPCMTVALSLILAGLSDFARAAFETQAASSVTARNEGSSSQPLVRVLRSKPAPGGGANAPPGQTLQDGQLHIESPFGYLDYDEETNQIYGRERTKIQYGDMTLEANRVVVDVGLQEAQAEGNVILKRADQTVKCDSIRYNFREGTGVAQNATGQIGPLYFTLKERNGQPAFEQLSKNESLFRNAVLTTCDSPVPMYTINAKEVIVVQGDRLMMRSATLRVRDIPVFYFPFYSRSLRGGTPWFFRIGHSTRSGAYIRVGYSYRHETKTPSWENDEIMVEKTRGHMDLFADYLSKRGPGAGLDYKYNFDFDRHNGQVQLYTLSDSNREVTGEEQSNRWQAYARHSSQLANDITLQAKIDAVSDPEVYYDILDSFSEYRTGRVPERQAQVAATLNREKYIARINFQIRDRIGRDRYTDFSNYGDNDQDFDVQPGVELDDKTDKGISMDRWGRVSAKAPEMNFASNSIRLGRQNLYYRIQLNLFNALDPGLNTVADGPFTAYDSIGNALYKGTDADAWVQGADLYQSLQHIHRFNERVTWLNQAGVGAGIAQRGAQQGDLVDASTFAPTGAIPSDLSHTAANGFYDGLWFTDPNTFHIGESDVLRSYDDISPGFTYADYSSRLNARFTDALQGFIRYRYRMTTEDYLGDWYASMGNQFVRSEIYNFPLRTNWLDSMLTYALVNPSLSLYTAAGYNLIGAADLWPNEDLWYYTPVGATYQTRSGRFRANSSVTFTQKQFYHPSDPRAFITDTVAWTGSATYQDPGEMWWLTVATSWWQLNNAPNVVSETSLFDEYNSELRLNPSFGARIGPKWMVQGATSLDLNNNNADTYSYYDYNHDEYVSANQGFIRDASFSLDRDLHDALLRLRIRLNRDVFGTSSEGSTNAGLLNNMDFSFTVTPKLPNAQSPFRIRHRDTLDKKFRPTELEG